MLDKLLVISNARMGSTYVYNTFREFDSRSKDTTENHLLTNEPFDKNDFDTVYKYTKEQPNIVSKIHARHIQSLGKDFKKYFDLFDKTLLLLRKDLFASATSLSVSVAKEQWGVHYPINDNVIKLDLDQLQKHIRQQWQDIRYLRSIARDYNINHSIWLEDYPTDISLWHIFNNKETMPNTGLSFPTYKSPQKSSTISNYDYCYELYLSVIQDLVPIRGLTIENNLIKEL